MCRFFHLESSISSDAIQSLLTLDTFCINVFQAEDDEDEQMDQDEEPQMQVVLHEVQVSLN